MTDRERWPGSAMSPDEFALTWPARLRVAGAVGTLDWFALGSAEADEATRIEHRSPGTGILFVLDRRAAQLASVSEQIGRTLHELDEARGHALALGADVDVLRARVDQAREEARREAPASASEPLPGAAP